MPNILLPDLLLSKTFPPCPVPKLYNCTQKKMIGEASPYYYILCFQVVLLPTLSNLHGYLDADNATKLDMLNCYDLSRGIDIGTNRRCHDYSYSLMAELYGGALGVYIFYNYLFHQLLHYIVTKIFEIRKKHFHPFLMQ